MQCNNKGSRKRRNRIIFAHPKRPPKNDLDELSFFSASATSSRALASLSDMMAASTKRTTVSYFFLVKTSLLLLNNSFLRRIHISNFDITFYSFQEQIARGESFKMPSVNHPLSFLLLSWSPW